MKLLKKENWWIWLLLLLFSFGTSTLVLGALLDVFKKDSWYTKWYYWVIGLLCLLLPFLTMIIIFNIQILCLTAAKLDVKGKELYLSPYIWIICAIIPILGWAMLLITPIYLSIAIIVNLKKQKGEKYI